MTNTYALSPKEFQSVSALEAKERFTHFVKRVADWELVWGLRNESGWVAAGDNENNSGFPVWPHPEYAAACATNEWADASPQSIDVRTFMESWLPNMAADCILLAVFPTPNLHGVMVSAPELLAALEQELANYE